MACRYLKLGQNIKSTCNKRGFRFYQKQKKMLFEIRETVQSLVFM